MRLRPLLTLMALALTLSGTGSALAASASAASQVGFSSIVDQFMCATCHEPLNQVNSPQAISEKQYLQGLIAKGLTMSPDQERRWSTSTGRTCWRDRRRSGFNLTVYILPPAVFLGGVGAAGLHAAEMARPRPPRQALAERRAARA